MACSKDNEKKFEGGYELKTVDEDKDLECSICLLLLRDAMGTPCSHAFCRVCLQKLIGQEDIRAAIFKCPDCQQPVDSDKVYPNAFVDRLVRRSDVYCSRKDEGCEWTGTLASFLQQHNSECNFQIVLCHNEGCVFSGIKSKIKEHESNCEYRMVQCEHCEAELKVHLLEKHYLSCERISTACPQNDCNAFFPKIEIQKHLDEDCKFAIVNCSFAMFGCSEKVLRKDLDRHNEDSIKQHMAFMCDKVLKSQSQIQHLENEVRELRGEVSVLTQSFPPFKLTKLLLNGVEKWINNNKNTVMEESYVEWCREIFSKTIENKLYQFDNSMFVKVKQQKKKTIYWSSNSKEEQEEACSNNDVLFYKGDNCYVLRIGDDQLVIETETLDSFNRDNSRAFALNPSDADKIISVFGSDQGSYSGWEICELSDDFCVNGFAIICLIKV